MFRITYINIAVHFLVTQKKYLFILREELNRHLNCHILEYVQPSNVRGKVEN